VYERNGAEGRFPVLPGFEDRSGKFQQRNTAGGSDPCPYASTLRAGDAPVAGMNFNLYYSRFALDNERLCMRFDSDTGNGQPREIILWVKELSTKADKQDDLLVQDFAILETTDSDHIIAIPETEKRVKYEYLQQWIQQTLDNITGLDAEKFSGGIAYMLLALVYRIDYLVSPEGKLLNDLEKIAGSILKKRKTGSGKNRDMIDEFRKIKAIPKEEIFKQLFRSKYTFAITAPQVYKTIGRFYSWRQ
jgi:hypothetical protein